MNTGKLIIEQERLSNARTNHVLHLILAVLTGGLWIIIWILVALSNAIERSTARKNIKKLAGK